MTAALSVGLARAAYDAALAYARERVGVRQADRASTRRSRSSSPTC